MRRGMLLAALLLVSACGKGEAVLSNVVRLLPLVPSPATTTPADPVTDDVVVNAWFHDTWT